MKKIFATVLAVLMLLSICACGNSGTAGGASEASEQQSVLAQLEARLREIIIVRLNAVIREPGTLERFAGKARRVDDRRYNRE